MGRGLVLTVGVAALAAASLGSTACGGSSASSSGSASSSAAKQYVIGIVDNVVGNGWRDELGCAAEVQAKLSGRVSKVINASANGSVSDEITQMRNLISAGVNAIIVDPADSSALNPVIDEAHAAGVVVVSVDSTVTDSNAYNFTNDQTKYGYDSALWLFQQLNGTGTVLELRGAAGSSADTDRHAGFEQALAAYPGIKVISEYTNWSIATGSQEVTQLLASGTTINGIDTPGMGQVVWSAYQAANVPYVPTAVSDNDGDLEGPATGASGPAVIVSNPAVVGGGGVTVALNVLEGKSQSKSVLLSPTVWSSTTASGLASIKAAYNARLGPYYSTDTSIPGYTTFTPDQLLLCQGP
jgi:ribose transport system substrate-binding protein